MAPVRFMNAPCTRPRPGLSLLRALCLAACCHLPLWAQATVTVTDDRGVAVTLDRPPQRIVSLLPSLTESVCALGRCERLVGVDRYSNFPARVQGLPRLGGGLDPQLEAILALRPDLVLMAQSARAAERLQALGLKVIALEPRTHADVRRVLITLGQVLDVPTAMDTWQGIDAGMAAAARSLPPESRATRVYFEVGAGPFAAGEASFIGETLARLGVRNIVPSSLGPFPKLNPEFVVRADPDLVMVGEGAAAGLSQRPGWQALRALREERLCVFTPAQSDLLVRPGPRMAEGARLMAECLASKAPRARDPRP